MFVECTARMRPHLVEVICSGFFVLNHAVEFDLSTTEDIQPLNGVGLFADDSFYKHPTSTRWMSLR